MTEITEKTVLVSAQGGVLDYVSADGELLFNVAVPPGLVDARPYVRICPPGASIQVAEGLYAAPPRSGAGVQSYGPGSHSSGANPDFQPNSAARQENELRVLLAKMQASTRRLEAREAALASVQRIPTAPAQAAPVEPSKGEAAIE